MARIDDIERTIGADGLAALAGAFGGTRVVVPHARNLGASHPLVLLLGPDAAQRLSAWAAGEYIEIPKCDFLERRRRDAEIFSLRQDGFSTREIARRFGFTERGIRLAMARHRADQPSGQ